MIPQPYSVLLESVGTRREVSAMKLVVKGRLPFLSSSLDVLYAGRFVADFLQWSVSNYLRSASLCEMKAESYTNLKSEASLQLTASMRCFHLLHGYFSSLPSQQNRMVVYV